MLRNPECFLKRGSLGVMGIAATQSVPIVMLALNRAA
jgi:hypothetical protein